MGNNPWRELYAEHTDRYERMIQAEDYQGQLLAAVRQLRPLADQAVVEFGAGTGRITAQLAPHVGQIQAFDLTPAMIQVAQRKLLQSDGRNWLVGVADSRAVPVPTASADIAIEGWSFVQIMSWQIETWQQEVGRAIKEMLRVLRPGGLAILIETLGTGLATPHAPERFRPVYEFFEREWHFASTWIRTDFHFPTLAAAHATLDPVFGEATLEGAVVSDDGVSLPECTGIWWRTV